ERRARGHAREARAEPGPEIDGPRVRRDEVGRDARDERRRARRREEVLLALLLEEDDLRRHGEVGASGEREDRLDALSRQRAREVQEVRRHSAAPRSVAEDEDAHQSRASTFAKTPSSCCQTATTGPLPPSALATQGSLAPCAIASSGFLRFSPNETPVISSAARSVPSSQTR